MKLEPVPVAGVPPGALQLNVYGAVPPVADAVNVTAVPTVPVVGPVTVTDGGVDEMLMDAVFDALALFESVAVALTT